MGMQDSFKNWPQGVPVRPTSPTDPSTFSSFIPGPTATQDLQRRPKKRQSFWKWAIDPVVKREQVRGSWLPDFLEKPIGAAIEYTTSPVDLALLGLAMFPLTSPLGIGGMTARAGITAGSKLIPAAIRASRGGQMAKSAGGFAARTLDPIAGSGASLPARMTVETGLNIGAGALGEELGERYGTAGGIGGALAGGALGVLATSKGVKGLRKGYEKAFSLPSIDEHLSKQQEALRLRNKRVEEIGKNPTLKDYIGVDPKDPNKFDVDSYLLESHLKFVRTKQESFKKWVDEMKNKVPSAVRAIVAKGNTPWVSKTGSFLNIPRHLHKLFDPVMYAKDEYQQLAHVSEMQKYTTSLLAGRLNNYLFSPLKSGRFFYSPEVFGKTDVTKGQLKGVMRRIFESNPRFGKITGGPLTQPENITKINNQFKKAGIDWKLELDATKGLNISEGQLAEEFLSRGSKRGEVWRNLDENIMTADMREHIQRLAEVYRFRTQLLESAKGRIMKIKTAEGYKPRHKKIDVKYIEEGDEAIVPFGATTKEIDDVLEDAINNTEKFIKEDGTRMTKQEVKDLHLSTGKFYMGRHVAHKIDPDTGEIEQGMVIANNFYKIIRGTKAGFEKQRQFQWMEQGMDEGWAYLPAHQSAILNVASVMKRINDVEVARLVEKEHKRFYKMGVKENTIKVYGDTDILTLSEKDVYRRWDKSRGKPSQKDLKIEKEIVSEQVKRVEWEATLKKDKELKAAAENLPKNYDKANQIIVTSMDLLDKIRKSPKTFKKIKKEVEELVKLKRFYPEIEVILGKNLLVKTNDDLTKVIKDMSKTIKDEYKQHGKLKFAVKDFHLQYAVRLEQARRVFGLKSRIDKIPTDRRTREYKEWMQTPDSKVFEEIATEWQSQVGQIYKSQEDKAIEIAKGRGKKGKDLPKRSEIKSSDMSADIKKLYASPEEYMFIKKLHDDIAQNGFKNVTREDVKKAIKLLDAQMSVRRGTTPYTFITMEDWRRASTFLNKSVFDRHMVEMTRHFENFINLKNVDLPKLTKRLEDNVEDLISKTAAYNDRYKKLIKAKMKRNKFEQLSPRSNLFRNMWVDASEKDKKAWNSLQNNIKRLEEVYRPKAITRMVEELNLVQRLAALALDSSLLTIQLVTTVFYKSDIWAGAAGKFVKQFYKGIRDPDQVQKSKLQMYGQDDNIEIMSRSKIVLSADPRQGGASLEFTQALEQNRLIDKVTRWGERRPYGVGVAAAAVSKPVGRTFTAAGEAFSFAMDYAGLELRKSLDNIALTPKDQAALDSFVNAIRGLGSSQASGVLAHQRMYESLFLLAPRYRRATITLYALSTQKGPVGAQARKAIMNTITGFMMVSTGFALGMSYLNNDSEQETENKLEELWNPDGGSFMLVDVAGQKVGIGGKLISDTKILSQVASAIHAGISTDKELDEYTNFLTLELGENSLFRWVRGQMAAAPKELVNGVMGETYMGERHFTREDNIEDAIFTAGRQLSENVMPLWISSLAHDTDITGWDMDEAKGFVTRGASDFMGLRSWPQNVGNLLQQESYELTGKAYADLEPYEKKVLLTFLKEELYSWQKKQVARTDNEKTLYFEQVREIDIEYYQGLRALMNRYPNTKEGNRNLLQAFRVLKGVRKGRRHQAGLDIEDDWGNRESDNPIIQAINERSDIYDIEGVEEAPGVYNWDLFDKEEQKLFARLTPAQVEAIKRQSNDTPYPVDFLKRLQSASPKEYKRIMQSQALREKHLMDTGRQNLIGLSRRRFFMLDEEENVDIEQE